MPILPQLAAAGHGVGWYRGYIGLAFGEPLLLYELLLLLEHMRSSPPQTLQIRFNFTRHIGKSFDGHHTPRTYSQQQLHQQ